MEHNTTALAKIINLERIKINSVCLNEYGNQIFQLPVILKVKQFILSYHPFDSIK